VTDHEVTSLGSLPAATAVLLDVTPRQLLAMAGDRLDGWHGWRLRQWRYGPAACKADYLLSGPMPWTAEACRHAGVLHLGGRFEDIARAERTTSAGTVAERPFVLVSQPVVADAGRAPAGRHVVWTYAHVPRGSGADESARIEAQFDRFAPGWRDLIVEKRVKTGMEFEAYDPNYVGGDIAGGSLGRGQLVVRPWGVFDPYRRRCARHVRLARRGARPQRPSAPFTNWVIWSAVISPVVRPFTAPSGPRTTRYGK
jgi:phytoene dehydrogenase-like protein